MSAPLSKPLFHGTSVVLKKGDLITPPKSGPRSLAFATEDIEHARVHATNAAQGKKAHKDSAKAKVSKKGIVYQVEPTENIRKDRLAGGPGVWVSKTGFKVVRKVK